MRRWVFVLALMFPAAASAQQGMLPVQVQQPVVSSFGAATTLSVPDRGSVLLGGVSSASSQSVRTGPFPTRSAWGTSFSASSVRTSVWIHDPAAMDEVLLREGEAAVAGLSALEQRQRAVEILRARTGARPLPQNSLKSDQSSVRALQILRAR